MYAVPPPRLAALVLVAAVGCSGSGSDVASAAPATPTMLGARASGPLVLVTWRNNATEDVLLALQAREAGAAWREIARLPKSLHQFAHEPGKLGTFSYRVAAVAPHGVSGWSAEARATLGRGESDPCGITMTTAAAVAPLAATSPGLWMWSAGDVVDEHRLRDRDEFLELGRDGRTWLAGRVRREQRGEDRVIDIDVLTRAASGLDGYAELWFGFAAGDFRDFGSRLTRGGVGTLPSRRVSLPFRALPLVHDAAYRVRIHVRVGAGTWSLHAGPLALARDVPLDTHVIVPVWYGS